MRKNPLGNDATMLFQRGVEETRVSSPMEKAVQAFSSLQPEKSIWRILDCEKYHLPVKDLSWTVNYLLCKKA